MDNVFVDILIGVFLLEVEMLKFILNFCVDIVVVDVRQRVMVKMKWCIEFFLIIVWYVYQFYVIVEMELVILIFIFVGIDYIVGFKFFKWFCFVNNYVRMGVIL